MEPLLIGLIPAILGGLALALLIPKLRRRTPLVAVPRPLDPPSPALINMASIRVEGIGGLGMVAAVIVVAITDPRIRMAIIAAAVLGIGLALTLIAMRKESGGLPSGDDGPDGRLPLGLDRGPVAPRVPHEPPPAGTGNGTRSSLGRLLHA